MARFTFCLAMLFSLVGLTPAAPVPKQSETKPYFPTTIGTKWVYVNAAGEEEGVAVSVVEKTDAGWVVTREGTGSNHSRYLKMTVTAAGLQQDSDPYTGDGSDGLRWVLKTKAGDSWDVPGGRRTVSGPEDVKVPAGTYRALRVVWKREDDTITSWYVAGVGEVKRTQTAADGTQRVTRSLKSFEAGK